MLFAMLCAETEYGNPSGRERLEECILQMAGGAADTLAVLYEQTKTAVYGFALSILRNQADAEDVLQETYLHIYQAAGRYKPNGNPMPWIFTITRNLALMKIRESKRQDELPAEDSAVFWAEDSALSAEDRLVLGAAMRELTDEERQILMLHAVTGMKHREIAELLQLSLSTVLSKYHRALKKLRKCLGGEERP